MESRDMLIAFEELIRNANPNLEYDTNINTDVIYNFLTKAEIQYIDANFLNGDNIVDQINAVRKRSDVLRKLIKRTGTATVNSGQILGDNGYPATFTETDCWMFLSGVLKHPLLPVSNKGSVLTNVELELINHYDLQKKIRTINNEPVLKKVPIVLEGANTFVFYLGKEYADIINGTAVLDITFNIIYLAFPPGIKDDIAYQPSLPSSTHNAIVDLAFQLFMKEDKYLLGANTTKQNG